MVGRQSCWYRRRLPCIAAVAVVGVDAAALTVVGAASLHEGMRVQKASPAASCSPARFQNPTTHWRMANHLPLQQEVSVFLIVPRVT